MDRIELPNEGADSLPDLPRWVETRWLLRAEGCRWVTSEGHRFWCIAIHPRAPFGAIVGKPTTEAFEILRSRPVPFEVVIQVEDAPHARSQLPGWVVGYGLIHVKPVSETAPTQRQENPNIVVQSPPEPELLARLPPLSRKWGGAAAAIAVWMHEGQPASVCAAAAVTESFWDVGIETQAEYRRRGYGRTCFEALEHRMAEKGKRPIWGADKKNSASLAMARRLGFEPIDEVVVLAKEL